MWKDRGDWDYRKINDRDALTDAYVELTKNLRVLNGRGLSGAVYTQTTDVEIEVNGHLTYDRAEFKLDPERVRQANAELQQPQLLITTLLPTSESIPQRWQFTHKQPPAEWTRGDFDARSWQQGPGAFGKVKTHPLIVRTEWEGDAIWLRRPFMLPENTAGEICLLTHHVGDADFFINGQPLQVGHAATAGYRLLRLDPAVLAKLQAGRNQLAVHVRPGAGEAYFDAGVVAVRHSDAAAKDLPTERKATE